MGNGGKGIRRSTWYTILFLATCFHLEAAESGDLGSKLKFHGFLSQAWAKTDGEPFLGITDEGTTDYRNVALQLRYQLAEHQSVVFQLGHERRGNSPREPFRDEVEIDWAFYEARFTHGAVRVGRIPVTLGIYGELRDAGHLLPFYGPPSVIYGETSFASEWVDGIGAAYSFGGDAPFNVELDAFFGQGEVFERSNFGGVRISSTDEDWGLRAWLNTPVEGLRVGLNHHSFNAPESLVLRDGEKQVFTYASFDLNRERYMVRAEFGKGDVLLPFLEADLEIGYLTLGFSPFPRFWVYLQGESREVMLTPKVAPDTKSYEATSISLTYNLSERVVLKAEHHDVTTSDLDRPVALLQRADVKATLVSLSVAF